MANEEIKGIIEYVLKEQGLDKAIVRLRRLEDQNKRAQKSLDGLSKTADNFGKNLVSALAPIASAAFLTGAFRKFAELDGALTSLRAGLQAIGRENDFAEVQAFLGALEETGYGLQTETIPAFVRFVGITRRVPQALALVRSAAIQAASKGQGLADVTSALANAWRGELTEAASKLGIQLDSTLSKADQQKEFFKQLRDQTEALADQARDASRASRELEAAWDEAYRSFGEGVYRSTESIGGPRGLVAIIKAIGPAFIKVGYQAAEVLLGIGRAAAAAFDFKALFVGGVDAYTAKLNQAYASALGTFKAEIAGAQQELDRIAEQLLDGGPPPAPEDIKPPPPPGGKRGKTDEEREAERAARLIEESYLRAYEARMKALEDLKEAEAKATEESIEQAVEAAKTREEIEKAAAEEALQLRVQAAQETQDELQAQDDQLRIQSREALLAAIDEEQQAKLDQLAWEYGQQIAAAERVGADTADIKRNWEAKKTTIESQGERARLNVVRQTEALKQQLWFQSASMLLGALSQAFEGNKSIAIAQAIINTAEGATKALSQFGAFGFVAAAAVIAAGVAQINRIRSTTIAGSGGGFGGGGGSRRAAAPIETRSPIRREAAEQERRGVQFRGEPQTVVNFHGPVVGGRQGARELARIVDRSRRDDGRRRLR